MRTFMTMLVGFLVITVDAQLLVDFYATSCPRAESVVTNAVEQASFSDPLVYPKLLRLMFHDCFVNGCDASVLIDSSGNNTAEKADLANQTVGGFDVIDAAKATLETVCAGVVSCADIVALAARDAVALSGGPQVAVPTGRRDGLVSLASNVRGNIPDTSNSVDQLLALFKSKGLQISDLVILAGGHTIGVAHCSAVKDRFTFVNGTAIVDPTLDPTYAQTLLASCPDFSSTTSTIPIDAISSSVFDADYFVNLGSGRGLMKTDEALFTDMRTRNLVSSFGTNNQVFEDNWKISFVEMANIGVLTAPSGEIRTNCRAFNS